MKNIKLGLQQAQKRILSQQLQQSIKLLQLSSVELLEQIQHEISDNPFLEEIVPSTKEEPYYNNNSNNINNNETVFEDSSDAGYINRNITNTENLGRKQEFLENTIEIKTTLYDHLLSQLRFLDLSDDEFYIGELVISSINNDGYLTSSVEEIASTTGKANDIVSAILEEIQAFDPPGIAGRNLKEVLIIQLKQKKEYDNFIETLILNDLNSLEKAKLNKLALKYNTNKDKLKKALEIITELEPIPARQFDESQIKYIVPDIIIKTSDTDDSFIITINDYLFPSIQINYNYKEILKKETLNTKTKSYFDDKYNRAKFLVSSIEKRKETIIKVTKELTAFQKEFFHKGIKYLKPLILKDIADKIDMHESTVSRVTSNKYVQTKWGIFPFKYFFSSKITSNGQALSSTTIKETIKNIIISEKDGKALSDQNITNILSDLGINISRRTVSKYRKNLKILPSFKRRD